MGFDVRVVATLRKPPSHHEVELLADQFEAASHTHGSKVVETLGRFPLPIEVNRFGLAATTIAIRDAASRLGLAGALTLRGGEDPFVTDGGHLILDASFGRIRDPEALSNALHLVPGVVEHGLFIGLATRAIIAFPDGVRQMTPVPNDREFRSS